MLKRVLLLLTCSSLLLAADFLPLESGNSWTYRRTGSGDAFTVSVGASTVINAQVYYPLNGYVNQPVLVRSGDDGAVYYRDEKLGQDVLLTAFRPDERFDAPLRPCAGEGAPEVSKDPYQGPAGRFAPPLAIRYRILNCADIGVTDEEYVENIGMVRRTATSIAGPWVYELISARVGGISIAARPNTAFRVGVQSIEDKRLVAGLRLTVNSGSPLKLVFTSSQEYELVLRNPAGDTLSVWSQGKAFLQALHTRTVDGELSFAVELPLAKPLDPGAYTLDGWLTTGPDRRQFSAAVNFEVPAPGSAAIAAARGCGDCARPPAPPALRRER